MASLEKHGGKYRIKYRDKAGKQRHITAYTDKQASRQLLAKYEKAWARGEQGLIDPFKEHADRPLAEHITDYTTDQQAKGRDDMHVYTTKRRLNKLAKECGWERLGDITPDSFSRWRDSQASIGAATKNQYLVAAKALLNWCIRMGRIGSNPLTAIGKVSGKVRRKRRAFTPEELARLFDVVPPKHRLAYRLMLLTGLRKQEAADLLWSDVHLEGDRPHLKLRPEATKSRKAATIPLRVDLASDLKAAKADATGPKVLQSILTTKRHKAYLEEAGIPYKDDQG